MELGLFLQDCYSNLEKAIMDDEYRYKMFDYYRL